MGLARTERKAEAELRAATLTRDTPYVPTLDRDQALADGEPETHPRSALC